MNITFLFDEAPNIDLLDKRVVWWNEDYICIKQENKRLQNERR